MTSLTQLSYNVRLGTCGKFYLRNFTLESGVKKTLMYFDHCEPQLGCAITLQGGTNRELKKVKKVAQFGLHLAHNSILESSFLLDEFAWPGKVEEEELMDDGLVTEHYKSTSSTPEIPLYPSLAHPLESLSPPSVMRRLEFLGLCGSPRKVDHQVKSDENEEEEGTVEEHKEDDSAHSGGVRNEQLSCTPKAAVNHQESQKSDPVREPENGTKATPGELGPGNEKSEPIAKITFDSSSEVQSSGEVEKSPPPPNFHSQDSEQTVESTENAVTTTTTDEHGSVESQELSNVSVEDSALRLESISPGILANLGEIEFRAALGRQLISISPRVKYNVPYLQTAAGRQADVRQYLSSVIYWSVQFASKPRKVCYPEIPSKEYKLAEEMAEMGLMDTLENQVKTEEGSGSGTTAKESKLRSQWSTQTHHLPSYKSVSEHPLTSSFLLVRANTNEMQAALADFRARAGLVEEDNNFFFKSAKLATNYRLLLQNVFNKYKQFEIELEEEEAAEEEEEEEGEEGKKRKGGRKKRKQKRKWWKRKVKESKRISDIDRNGSSHHMIDLEVHSDESDSDGEDLEGGVSDFNPPDESKDDQEVGGVNNAERGEEEDGVVIQAKVVARGSREHTPGISRSGKVGGQEVGAVFGNLEDMNQKQPPRRSAKDVGKDMPAYDLDMDYSDTWMAIDQVCIYMYVYNAWEDLHMLSRIVRR